MYKLLTTAAVIMTVATPTLAWDGAPELIEGLNSIYTGVDGQTHFTGLQSGALGDFVGEANKGVTHVTLTVADQAAVDEAAANGETIGLNTIIAGIEGGTSLANIQTAQSNLINQVNYDLFVDTTPDSVEAYTGTPTIPVDGTPITSVDKDGTVNWANANSGLVGAKVDKVVKAANAINDYLTSETGAATDTTAFTTAFDAKTGVFGTADIGNLFAHIDGGTLTDLTVVGGINNSITAAANGAGTFFGNVVDQQDVDVNKVKGSTISDFSTGAFTLNPADGKLSDGTNSFDSLLLWAQAQPDN